MSDDEFAQLFPQGPRFQRILETQKKGPDELYASAAKPVPSALHDAIGKAVMEMVAGGKEQWHRQENTGIPRYAPEPPLTLEVADINKIARTSGMRYDMAGVIRYHFARHGINLLDCELGAPGGADATSYEVKLNISEGEYAKLKPAVEAKPAAEAVGATVRGRGRGG